MTPKEISINDVARVLDLTIKHDEANKVITFLCMLSAYSEDSQFNVFFNAPSSSGKSYIVKEVAKLFPKEDVRFYAYSSPTAFYHEVGEEIDENQTVVDLERKIMIFVDQADNATLKRLRPLLSHDEKELRYSYTDRKQKSGLRAHVAIVKGFPAVLNCTAGANLDEQESTRFLLLSPDSSQDKIRSGIDLLVSQSVDQQKFNSELENNPERAAMRHRIQMIKGFHCTDIKVPQENVVKERFYQKHSRLKFRDQREMRWLLSLIKAVTLLNCFSRANSGTTLITTDDDIEAALKLWEGIAESQRFSISPLALGVYQGVIKPLWERRKSSGNLGITRGEIISYHAQNSVSSLDMRVLAEDILPALERSGHIEQKKSDVDHRVWLVYPPTGRSISPTKNNTPTA